MKCILILFAAITLSASLAGCSAKRLPDYTPSPLHEYSNKSVQEGLTIAIQPMTNEEEIKRYFGIDLLEKNVLPIFIVMENQSSKSSFVLTKKDIGLSNEEDQGSSPSNGSTSSPVSRSDEEVAAAMAIVTVFGPLFSAGMESFNAEVERNFAMKEFQQATLSPGNKESGFVYFRIPESTHDTNRWRVQIKAFDLTKRARLPFDYVFEWKRN